MVEGKRGNLKLVGLILLLIAIFVSFLVLLEFQKDNQVELNEETSLNSSENLNSIISSTKVDALKGLKAYLIIGGILVITGIIYLIFWIFSLSGTSKKENFEKNFSIKD